MKKMFTWLRRSQKGQSATEYMLVIAIVVLGLVAAASKFLPVFQKSIDEMSKDVAKDYMATRPRPSCPGGGPPPCS